MYPRDGQIHFPVDQIHVKGVHPLDGGEKVLLQDSAGGSGGLAEVPAEITAPLRHGGSLPKTLDAVIGGDLQDDIALANVHGAGGPGVLTPGGDADLKERIVGNFHWESLLSLRRIPGGENPVQDETAYLLHRHAAQAHFFQVTPSRW